MRLLRRKQQKMLMLANISENLLPDSKLRINAILSRTVIWPESGRLYSQTGSKQGNIILVPSGTAGYALFGPYLKLVSGMYRAIVWFDSFIITPKGRATIEVISENVLSIASQTVDGSEISGDDSRLELDFELAQLADKVEIRILGSSDFCGAILCVELLRIDRTLKTLLPKAFKPLPPLHILYSSVHGVLEYDEIRMLCDNGHRVFSLEGGHYHVPGIGNTLRPSPVWFFQQDDYYRWNSLGESPAFLNDFDIIISMDQPRRVPAWCDLAPTKPIIYRSIGQHAVGREDPIIPYQGRATVVRYSNREAEMSGLPPTDEVLYFAKYEADFDQEWTGGGPIITIMNGFVSRSAQTVPNMDQYCGIVSGFDVEFFGSGNAGFLHDSGLLAPEQMAAKLKAASIFLYTCTAGPSYSLTFIEALAAGVPILAPTADMIVATTDAGYLYYCRFEASRYEVPDLLANDEHVLYSNVSEAREKIAWLLQNREYCELISRRQRATFRDRFSADTVRMQWESMLRRLTAPVDGLPS